MNYLPGLSLRLDFVCFYSYTNDRYDFHGTNSFEVDFFFSFSESNNRVLNITTKKVFRLHNTGQVSVHIFGFTINGLPCQGYGFKITNCHNTPFILKPGMSKRVSISIVRLCTH